MDKEAGVGWVDQPGTGGAKTVEEETGSRENKIARVEKTC
jgi:hypothetical protein